MMLVMMLYYHTRRTLSNNMSSESWCFTEVETKIAAFSVPGQMLG
jgi:hypothetical protein